MRKPFAIAALLSSLLFSFASIAKRADAGEAVKTALKASQISSSDKVELRVKKALRLLNEQHYFQPDGPPKPLDPPFDNSYHLDSLRTPEEILAQKKGGGCASAGLSLAAILSASGVPTDNIRIVGTVVNRDLIKICPQSGKTLKTLPHIGLSGHVFVLVKTESGTWKLFNATDTSQASDSTDFMSPEDLATKTADGPVQIPHAAYLSMSKDPYIPPDFKAGLDSGMTIFSTWKLNEYPKHTFTDRYNLVASGDIHNSACRYDEKEVHSAVEKLMTDKKNLQRTVGTPGDQKVPSASKAH